MNYNINIKLISHLKLIDHGLFSNFFHLLVGIRYSVHPPILQIHTKSFPGYGYRT